MFQQNSTRDVFRDTGLKYMSGLTVSKIMSNVFFYIYFQHYRT